MIHIKDKNTLKVLILCLFLVLSENCSRRTEFTEIKQRTTIINGQYYYDILVSNCPDSIGELKSQMISFYNMTERQADSLLRADLWKCFEHFKGYGKDALLLTLLAYNVGVGRLLGYGKYSKSRLLRKIEAGDRNFYWEYVSFCRYKGKVLRGLVKRRQVEYMLFRLP